jgi:hypothetical protein
VDWVWGRSNESGPATRNGIDLPPLCAIWIGNAHWTRHARVEDRLCFFFLHNSSNAWSGRTLRLPQFNVHSDAPRTLRTHSNGRNPPRSTSILPNDCHKPTVPHELPHWILGRCHIVPQKHANTNGTVTRHTAKFVEFVPDNCHPNTIRILPKSLMITPPLATSTPPTPCPNKAPRQRTYRTLAKYATRPPPWGPKCHANNPSY